jgi:Pectinacetylesterase
MTDQPLLTPRRFTIVRLGTTTRRLVALLLLLAALATTVTACGGNDDNAGAAATTAPATTTAPADQTWKKVVPGGDCQCSDGSGFNFWVREANPEKVVFYLGGGGACFSAETCAPERDLYKTTVEDDPTQQSGIFDLDDERNPFADYSIVYVPYCTADVHIGDTITKYAPGLTIRHKGSVNATAALDRLAATFPSASEVVVIGESAGSIAAPLYAGILSDRLPDTRVTVLGDASGSYPDVPRINELFAAWGIGSAIPAWPENAGLTDEQWSPSRFVIQSARHDPEIVFARHDHTSDDEQERFAEFLGLPPKNLLSRVAANEAQIERAGVNLLSYVGPGEEHTVFSDGPFYTETVKGETLVDWVTRVIEGKPVDDVHCTKCKGD